MAPIRVLVVDDAVVVRRMVSDVLAEDPDIQVVGAAANGRIALAKIPQVNPDLVTMDVEMPEMDGLQTLAALRKTHPLLPVIMFSTLTQRGGVATLDALALGANDYVTKPANVGSVAAAMQQVREQLIPKIKLFCRRVVAIGVSTGGPNALAVVIPALPADFPVPVLIVQHMPPLFTRLLAERLASKSPLDIRESTAGEVVRAGSVRVAPGDFHLTVQKGAAGASVKLHQGPPENSCRPAVDVLFRSVVEVYGAGVLGVVLTGMGQDGLRGAEAIREGGGQVIVQDEATSVVWGMPGFVARAGLADEIAPLEDVAGAILRLTAAGRPRPQQV